MTMRDLHLTSPLMRGVDIQHFQVALNARLAARGESAYRVRPDGVYGPASVHAVALVAYDLGLHHTDAITAVIRLIEHPQLRNPVQLALAHKRDIARRHHQSLGGSGLAAIPRIAARYIGVEENPWGSNEGHPEPSGWEEHFGMNGVSWCGCFAGNMVLAAGGHVDSRVAYCPSIRADAQAHMNGFDRWEDNHQAGVSPGWLVLYCWDGSGLPEHVGVVESIHSDHLVAIEGNTGGRNPSAGGMVDRITRDYQFTVGYARPRI